MLVGIEDVRAAAARIDGLVRPTPLRPSDRLSEELGCRVLLKPESLQHTGSFKVRGVFNALLRWRELGELPAGVATFSAGNHAAAVSYAARTLGLPAVVCMPPGAVETKVAAVHRYGGEIVFTERLLDTCTAIAQERGLRVLHPFDSLDVIAGQGTVGLEICAEEAPELVVVPVGGGGLISGVAAAVKALAPSARVVGVEPESAAAMSHALAVGWAEPLPGKPRSLADGLTAPFAGEHTLAHARAFVDEIVTIPEEAIAPAWWSMMDGAKLLVEPSAAVGLAVVATGAVKLPAGGTVVFVLSGGNTSPAALGQLA